MVWWTAALFALTGVAVVWLRMSDVDPEKGFSPAILVVGYAPLLAALAVTAARGGVGAIGALLRQVTVWRVTLGWYALVLLSPFALVLIADAAYTVLRPGSASDWLAVPSAAALVASLGAVVGPVVAGAVGEEIGWRGFAQPRLQRVASALTASLVIGFVWATWHQWVLLAPGATVEPLDIVAGYVRLVSTAVVYGWLYNASRSLLIVMIAHAAHNVAVTMLPVPVEGDGVWHLLLALAYAVAAVLAAYALRRVRPHD